MISETFDNWALGVVTAVRPDQLPKGAFPKGRNTALVAIGPGQAKVLQRLGNVLLNSTPVTGSPQIIGQGLYKKRSGSTYTNYHLLISDNGRLDRYLSAAASAADPATPTPFTTGELWPSMQQANNAFFMVNGTDAKKFVGTGQNFGLTAPAAPTAAANGAGVMSGTYEFALTGYNNNTPNESSRGALVSRTTAGSETIRVSWSEAGWDAQITHVRVHVRKPSTQSVFFQAAEVATGVGLKDLNVSDADLAALTTKTPSTIENDPPQQGQQISVGT